MYKYVFSQKNNFTINTVLFICLPETFFLPFILWRAKRKTKSTCRRLGNHYKKESINIKIVNFVIIFRRASEYYVYFIFKKHIDRGSRSRDSVLHFFSSTSHLWSILTFIRITIMKTMNWNSINECFKI